MTAIRKKRLALQVKVGRDGTVAHMGDGFGGTHWRIKCRTCWEVAPKGKHPGTRVTIDGADPEIAWTLWQLHLPKHDTPR